jgi:hypothetical protein
MSNHKYYYNDTVGLCFFDTDKIETLQVNAKSMKWHETEEEAIIFFLRDQLIQNYTTLKVVADRKKTAEKKVEKINTKLDFYRSKFPEYFV